jgi:hypothetical protein
MHMHMRNSPQAGEIRSKSCDAGQQGSTMPHPSHVNARRLLLRQEHHMHG